MRLIAPLVAAVSLFTGTLDAFAQDCALPFPGSQVTIVSGTLNGQPIDPASPRAMTTPGTSLTGTVRIRVTNTGPNNDVFPVAWTPSWGADHSNIGHSITSHQAPGTTEYEVPVNVTTSSTEGVGYLFFAAQWEMSYGNVLSCTAWNMPGNLWNDGRDVADWSSTHAQQAMSRGWVCSAWNIVTGAITQGVPATAIKVENSCSLPFSGSQIAIVGGTLNGRDLDPSAPRIEIAPQGQITGTVRIRVKNTGPSNDVFPVAWTPSWGADHAAIARRIASHQTPGTTEYDVPINLTADSTSGTQHVFFAAQWEMSGSNVLSCTAWNLPGNLWNDGRDVADWSSDQAQQAMSRGWVCSEWNILTGVITQGVPAAALQIDVPPNSTPAQKASWGAVKALYR
jgi:hypothetical protein